MRSYAQTRKAWRRRISIRSQRSRAYLEAALALTSVIPLLSFCVIMLSLFTGLLPDSTILRVGVTIMAVFSGMGGYLMLRVYPANLERVRDYLARIAAEDLPDRAQLLPGEQDFGDIEVSLNQVIGRLQQRIDALNRELARSRELLETVERQAGEILEAERLRVMVESLGAACHHIGQPMTVLSLYLTRLRDQPGNGLPDPRELDVCLHAVESISAILKKLMRVSEYRTVPYAVIRDATSASSDEHVQILDIEPAKRPAEERDRFVNAQA